jgi:hypothetical protein
MTMNKNDNTDEKPESVRDALLRVALLIGQPDNGKSFVANLMVDFGNLIRKKKVFLGDGEEGTNLVFSRVSTRRIKSVKLETEQDVDSLVTAMEDGGYTHGLLDTAGSSQRPIRSACKDFADLDASDVRFIPVIVVGSREGAIRVAIDWLRIVHKLPKIYWIWNNQNYEKEDNRQLPEDLEKEFPGITKKIVLIRIPPLRDDIAKEITKYGVPPSRVAAGLADQSVLLRHRNTKGKVGRWIEAAKKALEPLLNEFPGEVSQEQDDAPAEAPEPDSAVETSAPVSA